MNSLTTKARYSLQGRTSPRDAAKHVAKLFATLQSDYKGAAQKAVIANYLDVVSDIPEWAVERAVDMYRKGHKGNGRFVPVAAEFAQTARGLVEVEQKRKSEQLRRKRDAEGLAKQFAELKQRELVRAGITPESKARAQQKLEEAKAIIAENQLAEAERTKRTEGPSIHEQTHEKYRAQGREALLKFLGKQKPVAERGPEPEFQGEASQGS